MAEQETLTKPTAETDGDVKTWKRRGLLAAAWAAVAAIVAKQTTALVEAGVDGDVVLGAINTETTTTIINNTTANGSALQLLANAGTGTALEAISHGYGVVGFVNPGVHQPGGAAIFGQGNAEDNLGVWGFNSANGIGVLGTAVGGVAVKGEITSGSDQAIAIYGLNNSSYTGPGPGAGGFGVYGLSAKGHGLVGATAAPGAAAVVGATNGVAGAYAGAFYGSVIVGGDFTVFGAKSAAVPHPDGSHRLLYSMESPESWFEDFGKGRLECGQADVTIDPNFAAVANLEDYHVFVTGYDGQSDLSVCERTSSGFQVRVKDATRPGRFSWRVVAKRKDIVGQRLAKVTIPPEPQLPPVPSPDEAHMPPDIRSRMVRR